MPNLKAHAIRMLVTFRGVGVLPPVVLGLELQSDQQPSPGA